jgi:hypothetical protein
MGVPAVQFPVEYERIPAEVRRLTEFIRGHRAEIDIAATMLRNIREGCPHTDAKRGWNERDGDWMNPCPHCGESR